MKQMLIVTNVWQTYLVLCFSYLGCVHSLVVIAVQRGIKMPNSNCSQGHCIHFHTNILQKGIISSYGLNSMEDLNSNIGNHSSSMLKLWRYTPHGVRRIHLPCPLYQPPFSRPIYTPSPSISLYLSIILMLYHLKQSTKFKIY